MCSRGSVIPLFVEQIKANKPLTITDPAMTRFLMNLDEAVDLVLFAFENASPGDIMVQKSPASTIGDLAIAVQELFSSKNPINYIGIRHGEKKYETLLTKEECMHATDMGNFYRVPADNRDLNYEQYFEQGKAGAKLEEFTSDNTTRLNVEQIKEKLLTTDYIKEELAK
jgi:UDP-glucose 4-epimerase